MLKPVPSAPLRPFRITEDDYNSLESSLKSLQLIERLADEYNPTIGVIETELVAAALGMVTEKLAAILGSAKATFE